MFRCVLAASSPYFQATFSNQFQEAINARVILHDVSPWTVKRILDYIYSGQLEITLDNALDYLRTGHMLHYPDIVDACCDFLSNNLHPSNCLGIKELGSLYGCTALEELAFNYALENFSSVVERSEELSELPLPSLVTYLSADNADICNEVIMWKALRQWVTADTDNRKEYLYKLLSCVRLPVLTSKELGVIASETLIRSQPNCVRLLERASNGAGDKLSTVSRCDDRPDNIILQVALQSTMHDLWSCLHITRFFCYFNHKSCSRTLQKH